jgi:DNA primase
MQEEALRSILSQLPDVEKVGSSGSGFLAIPCAVAALRHKSGTDSHPSMTVSISDGLSFVHCWSCGYKKPLVNMLLELNTELGGYAALALEAQRIENARDIRPINMIKSETNIPVTDYTSIISELYLNPWSEKAIEFLNAKGVDVKTATAFKCAYAPEGTTIDMPDGSELRTRDDLIIFPVFSKMPDGSFKCVGAQARSVDSEKKGPKYFALLPFKGIGFFFAEQMMDLRKDQPIFIVEGPLDAMHVVQEGYRSLALMGLGLQEKKVLKLQAANARYVILLLDPDQPAKNAAEVIKKTLTRYGIQHIVRTPEVDPKYLSKLDLQHFLLEKQKWD